MARSKFNALGLRVKLEGLEELQRNVAQLNDKVRKRVLGVSAAAGAAVIRDEARTNHKWKTQSGDLADAIKHRRSWKESKQDYEVRQIGVFKVKGGKYTNNARNRRLGRVGQEYQEEPPEYYWRFLEFGTVRGIGPNEFSFLRPAFNSKKRAAADKTVETLRKRLAEVVSELPKPRKGAK